MHETATHTADLYALILKLRPLQPGSLMPFSGELVHGALITWLNGSAPQLATELHKGQQRRLFTCSSLQPRTGTPLQNEQGNVYLTLWPEQTYTVRITLLRQDLFVHFHQALTQFETIPTQSTKGETSPPFMRIGKQIFLLEEVIAEPDVWSGHQRLASLVEEVKETHPQKITLEFASLTTFSSSQPAEARGREASFWPGKSCLLPLPRLVFEGLARRWQDLAPAHLAALVQQEQLGPYLQSGGIMVNDYHLTKHTVHFAKFEQHGFVGQCQYQLLQPSPDQPATASAEQQLSLPQQLLLLARLAFYTGVGYKTTMGLGQTRLIEQVRQRTSACQQTLRGLRDTEHRAEAQASQKSQKEPERSRPLIAHFHYLTQARRLYLTHPTGLTDSELATALAIPLRQASLYRQELLAKEVSPNHYHLSPTPEDLLLAQALLGRPATQPPPTSF